MGSRICMPHWIDPWFCLLSQYCPLHPGLLCPAFVVSWSDHHLLLLSQDFESVHPAELNTIAVFFYSGLPWIRSFYAQFLWPSLPFSFTVLPTRSEYLCHTWLTISSVFFHSAVHWILSLYAQLDFMAQYLKLVQFLMVSHFYWTLATRALRKEKLTRRWEDCKAPS